MPKGIPNKKYSGEFKQKVIEDVIQNKLSQREATAKYGIANKTQVLRWERIYLERGPEVLLLSSFVHSSPRCRAANG